ncbi:hypothetical protein HLV37_02335 [Eggerthellaceae bacterium zg-1084]|uniref:hypothetical protein n=1 Tax=Berryella wangjianweii TaxID=2734634 RepID=UPI0015577ABD|nr:hypothetical protein [Berryella wangjianweii]NPD30718.1 hypothetical protein [Berryella wangjianweii]NPD32063.1 hypothetical protein [Eggerthellaceae bacterium zg-997]
MRDLLTLSASLGVAKPAALTCVACACVCVALMAHATWVDVACRRIPRADCWLIAMLGAMVQLVGGGAAALGQGIAFGALTVCCSLALNAVLGERDDGVPGIGAGDIRCMGALSIAGGPFASWGFAACFVIAAVWGTVRSLIRRSRRGALRDAMRSEAMPFAPFLMVWMVMDAVLGTAAALRLAAGTM